MNKHLYRIVFNKRRGQLMVVAETTGSHGKSAAAETRPAGATSGAATSECSPHAAWSPLCLAVLAAFGNLAALPVHAQIVGDPSAPGGQRPTVLVTNSGVPQVDIATPSAAGVSRNTYTQFDVDRRGAIFNNSRTDTQTQLGGWVHGNGNLANGSARVILNEVNSSNPSQLGGFVEVAGRRAEVVIANPAGLKVDGGGFINASRVTLTTGTPIMNGGSLEGYAVRRGVVTISGEGLDTSQTDYTAILARALEVNAGIWSQQLRVVTGANQLDAGHNVTGAAAAEGPELSYALDVAALGGMYAGKIMLVGTEAGLGVRNAGTLVSTGELTLDANGWLANSGTLQAADKLTVAVAGNAVNSGTVRSGADALVTSSGNIGNSGTIKAAGNLALRAEGPQSRIDSSTGSLLVAGLNADATLSVAGVLDVRATDTVAVHGSALAGATGTLAGKTLDIDGATLNAGAMSLAASSGDLGLKGTHIAVAGQLDLSAAGMLRTDAASVRAGQLALMAASLSNVSGDIEQSGSDDLAIRLSGQIDNTHGRIATNSGNLTLDAQALANSGGTLSHAGAGILAIKTGRIDGQGGTFISNGKLDLAATDFDHRGASTSASQLVIHAATLDNSGGTIAQTGAGQASVTLDAGLDNAGGTITSGGSLALAAASLDNRYGRVNVMRDAGLRLAGSVDNSGGTLAGTTLALHAGDVRNSVGTIQAIRGDGTLIVGALDNSGGSIAAAGNLHTDASSLANSGSLYAGADQTLAVRGALTNSGMIEAQGDATVTAASIDARTDSLLGAGPHEDGSLTAGGELRVTTIGALAMQGQVIAARAATLSGAAIDLSYSQVQADDIALAASTGSIDTSVAQLTTGGTLTLSTDAASGQGWRNARGQVVARQLTLHANFLDNNGGSIAQFGGANATLQLSGLASLLNNTDGRIVASGANASLRADTVLNAGGKLEYTGSGSLALQAGRLDNAAGLLRSTGSFTLDVGTIINHAGEMRAGSDLLARLEGDLDTDGTLYAGRKLTLDVAGSLNNVGSIAAQGDIAITAAHVHSSGLLGAGLDARGELAGSGSLAVSSTGELATSGRNVAANSLRLQGGTLNLAGSTATASGISLATDGAIDTRGATVHAADTMAVHGSNLRNGSGQLSARALDIGVAALDNAGGAILQAGQGRLDLHAVVLDNSAGRIAGDGTLAIHAGDVNNAGGTVAGAQGLVIAAADVGNRGGQIRSASGAVTLAVRDLSNDGGAIFADAELATSARNVDNGGSLYAAGAQTLAASGMVVNSGVIAAGGDTAITAASLANSHVVGAGLSADGVLAGSGSLTVNTSGVLQSDGRNIAAGNASLAGAVLDLAGSETTAANVALAATGGGIDTGAALVSTAGTLRAAATGVLANHDGVLSAGQLDLWAGALDNKSGTILQTGSGDTVIRTGLLDNRGGRLGVNSRNLSLEAAALRNAGGRVEHAGAGTLDVQAGPVDNRSGRISSAGSAIIAVTGTFDNTDGATSAAGGVRLSAGAIDNSGGLLRAAAGALLVDGASLLNTDGELSAGGDLRVSLGGDLRSDGLLYAGGTQTLNVGGTLVNGGTIASLRDTTIMAGSVNSSGLLGAGVDEDGTVITGGKLHVSADATVAVGQNVAGGDLAFQGGAINLSHSKTAGANITLDSDSAELSTRGATVTTSGKLALMAGHADNSGGRLEGAGVALAASRLDNAAGTIIQRGSGDMRVAAGTLDNTSGQVAALNGSLALDVGNVGNHDGLLQAARNLAVDAADVDNTGGDLRAAGGKLTLAVRDLDNTAGTVFAGGDLAAQARDIANSGSIYAGGNQTMTASGVVNSSGILAAQGNTTLSAATLASSGLLGAGVRADGSLVATGDLSVTSGGALHAGGTNLAAGNAAFSAATLDLAGSETSGSAIYLGANAGQVDTRRALVATAGTLAIDAQAGGLVNTGGALSAGQLDLQASRIDNASGTILQTGSGDTVIDTAALDNSGGRLATNSSNLHIGAALVDNTGGRIEHAGTGTLAIDTRILGNTGGHIISSGTANVGADVRFDNLNGVVGAATDLHIRGGAIANQGGLMQAKAGALTLDAAGFANGNGEISAGGAMRLETSGDLSNEGLLYAGASLGLEVGGALRSTGSIAALGDTDIGAGSLQSSGLLAAGINADGSFSSVGNLHVTSAQALTATGQNVAAGDASLRAARIDLSGGETSARNVTVEASAGGIDTGANALVKADGTLAISTAGALNNTTGTLNAGKITLGVASMDNHAGNIVQSGAGDMHMQMGALDNTNGYIAAAAGSLDLSATTLTNTGGALLAASNVAVGAMTLDNTGGEIRGAGGNVTLSANAIANGTGSSVYAAGNLDTRTGTLANSGGLYAAGSQSLIATGSIDNDGIIAAQGNTTIAAASLSGNAHALLGAGMRSDGTLLASGKLSVDTRGLAEARGKNLAGGDVAIRGGVIDLTGSQTGGANVSLSAASGDVTTSGDAQVATTGTLAITAAGALVNTDGVLSAGQLAVSAGSIDNIRGTIMQSGRGDTALAAAMLDNRDGWISVNSANLHIEMTTLNNAGGTIQHAGSGTLTVRARTLGNAGGHINSATASDVAATAALHNQDGVIAGRNGLRVGGGALDNGNGLMRATNGSLTLDAASLVSSGEVSAGGDVRLSVSGDFANEGLVYAGANQTLGAGGLLHGGGSIAALGNLDVHAGRVDSNGLFGAGMRADGSLASSGNLALTSSGGLKAGGDKLAAGSVSLRGAGIDLSRSYTDETARPLMAGTGISVDAGAGTLDTSGAVLSSTGALTLSGAALANRHGELGGTQVSLAVSTLDNAGGVIVQNGSGDLAVNVSALDNTGGRITAANGSLGVSASNIDNTQGMLAAADNVRVEGGADLVNQGGKIQGLAGDVTLHVRDMRNNGGSVFAGRNLSTTARDVDNGGSLFAAGSQTLAASGAVDGGGVIAAQGNVTVNAASLAAGAGSLLGAGIRADGTLGAGGRLAVTTSQTLQAGGQVLAGGNAELSGTSLNLAGSQASAANMALTADSGNIDTRGATLTTGTLVLTASRNGVQTWTNVGGDVQANQLQAQVSNLANAAGKIIQLGSGDVLLSTSGTFDNSGGQIAVNSRNLALRADALSNAGGTITHAGSGALTIEAGHFDGHDGNITGNGSLSLRANNINHRNGDLSAQRVAISATTLDNSGNGRIIQFGTGEGGITITHALNNAGGRIGSNGSTTIAAGALDNSGGGVLQAGGTADLNLNVGGILANSGGSITVGGSGLLSAGSVDNRYGTATAAGAMRIDTGGQLSNTGGTLAASGDLAVAAANLDNTTGKLISTGGNLTLENTGATTNRSGQIQAAGKVDMIISGLANDAGGVVSGHDVDIDTHEQGMNNAGGTIAATSAANLQTGALNNDGGRIQSGSTLVIHTNGQALVNINAAAYGALKPGYSGGITGGTATTLYTGNLDNSAGFLAAGGQLSGSTAYLTNAGGEIAGMRSVSFTTSGLNNQGGSIQAVDSLGFDVSGGTIMNYAGLLRAGQALTLNADVIDNNATQGSNQGIEGGDLTLNSADLNNSGGALRANNNLTVSSAGTVGNSSGLMSAMKSLSILDTGAGRTLAIDNAGGTLIGGEMTAIRAASLDGVGRVLSQQDMNIDLAGGYALEAGTELIGNRNVMLSLGGGLSNAGKLQAGGTLSLNAANLDNAASGDINGGSTRINAGLLINRGVIDGINTDIDTGTLTNVGTGRIYGDRIGIAAGSVVNDVENGMAGTIAARSYLALGASSISNREHALIFSGGDMSIGGRLDGNRDAVGWMGSLTNASATVEALGSMTIGASRTNVLNNHFTTTAGDFGPSVVITEYFVGNTPYSPESGAHLEMDTTVYDHYVLVTPTGRYTDYEIHTTYRSTASTVVQSSDPGVLAAGANLTLASDAVLNQNSQIVAGQALNIPGDVLTNESTASKTVVREHVTVDHREYHGVTDIKPGYYDTSTNWTMSYDKPDVVIDGASGFTFHHTPSSAPAAKAAITVSGSTSAASAATVSESAQFTVSGPSVLTASDSVDGRQASVTMGSNAAVNAAHLGVAAQTGALQGVIHGTPRAVLAGTRDVSTVGTVATVGIIGAAGAVASASSTGIDGSSASLGAIRIGVRKTAGETGTMAAVGGVRSTAPIEAVGGIGGVGQPTEIPTEITIGDRKDASVASSVTGVTSTGSTGAIAATINESHVSVIVPSLPSAPTPAGATGTSVAPFPAWAAAGGPKPGTSTPNVRDIAQVPLASPSANAEVVRTSTEALVVPNASLYKVSPAPSATYLVQTDPRFTDYRAWTSADYLTKKVPTDPSVTQKRLGDGFYEQQLVREQMTALTGYRYSGNYTSDEQQYRGLMDAAASFAATWNLRPGVALTAAQMAALTSDIVWLVEQNVTLADGSTQKVLVPQVYVRVREGDLDGSGALLSGKKVNIALNADLTSSGTIAGRQVVNISAENINNLSGRIHGDDVTLQARNDLNNISGTISANTTLVISAGRDINSAAGTANITRDGWTESLAGRVAGLYVTGNESGQGSLVAMAGGDINLSGSIISNNVAAGTSSLVAQRNLNLSAAKDSDLSADRRVELSAGGAMALKAGADLNILAANSQVSALHLRADNDINNIGNTLSAKNSLVASAGRDINLRTATTSVSLGTSRTGSDSTTLDKVAGLSVTGTGAGSTLLVSAGRDINLAAAEIGNAGVGGATGLNALRDLNLGTVTIAARNDTVKNANNYRKENSKSEIGTVINGAGSVLLDAGNNLSVRAGQVDAGTGLSVNAGNNIDITTGTASYSLDQSTQTSKSGFLSKKVTTKRDTVDMVTSISSTLTGSMVSMRAGNDLNVTGSAVVGDAAVKLAAGKDINIVAAIDTSSEWNHVEEKKSGFLSAGGLGISYGTRTTTTNQTRDAVTQSGQARSMVGSIGGDLMLDAGNVIKVSGTDMSASQDMSLASKAVTIDAGKDKIDSKFETRMVQDAISLRVGGSVVNAIQSVQGVQQAVEATDNRRVQAMAAATAAMAVKDAATQVKDGLSVSLSLTAGHLESVQTTSISDTLHTGSVLTAGRNVTIVAAGENKNSAINIIGSEIHAGRNVALASAGEVNLNAAQDLESKFSESKNISMSAGVGGSVSTKGISAGLTASISAGHGSENGAGVTQLNSYVAAGHVLSVESGGDTNIKGAVLSGNQISANISGNLMIESQQDTATFAGKNQNLSVNGTVGFGFSSGSGSAGLANKNSNMNYVNVQEQSGIRAGEGGFQIRVGRDTDLKGGILIGAHDPSKNILNTNRLTWSDLSNHSDASVSSSGMGLSGSSDQNFGKYQFGKMLLANAMNNGGQSQASTGQMKAAISDAKIIIRDDQGQISLTGKDVAGSIASLNRDASGANIVVKKQDIESLETSGWIKQEFSNMLTNQAFKYSDRANEILFELDTKLYRVSCDGAPNDCLNNPKRILVEPASRDQVVDKGNIIAVNGILNDKTRAGELAYQNAPLVAGEKPESIILMHIPRPEDGMADVIVAAYEKNLAPIFGYSNADQDYAALLVLRGQQETLSLGHSRGTIVQYNALNILHDNGITNNNLSVTGVGGAVLAKSYFEAAARVNNNSGDGGGGAGMSNAIDYVFMKNDPIPVLAGFNGFLGDGNILNSLVEFKNVYYYPYSAHSCYGSGAENCATIASSVAGGPGQVKPAKDNIIWYHNGGKDKGNK